MCVYAYVCVCHEYVVYIYVSAVCVCACAVRGCLSGRAVWSRFIGSSQSYGSAKANTLPLSVSLHIAVLFPFSLSCSL